MSLFVISIIVQDLLIVHCIKTGRNTLWIWVIALLSYAGIIAYVAVELVPELLRSRSFIADFNPFHHLMEIVRAPLLGNLPSAESYIAVLLTTLVNVVIVATFFARFRSRISYWV